MSSSIFIAGATGLTGFATFKAALNSQFQSVTTLTRRSVPTPSPASVSHNDVVIDFENPQTWRALFGKVGEKRVFVSCLGTTKAAAGTLANQRKIDVDLNVQLAKAAKEAGVETYILVSSGMASSSSYSPYLKMKGELEDSVKALNFPSTYILQPGLLFGPREKKRTAEGWTQTVFKGLRSVGLPMDGLMVDAEDVGACITKLALSHEEGVHYLNNNEIIALARQ